MSALLGNGISALTAFSRALSTISHNVSNASTPGYSRQRLELSARPGTPYGFGFIGAGVQVDTVRRVVDQFHVSRMLDSGAELGRLKEMAALAKRIDKAISDNATGVNQPWSRFLDSAQSVASQPTSTAARQDLLAQGAAFANRLKSLDSQLKAMNLELNGKLQAGVGEANRLSTEIARVNQEIIRQKGASGGQEPNDLLDQRERLLRELSGLTGVTAALQSDGAMNVFSPNGQALVVGTNAMKLSTVSDPYRPERLELAIQTPNGVVGLGPNAVGGELAGLLEFRNTTLDATAVQIGRIAATAVHSFNAQHRAGVDLYGQPGGDFFRPIQPNVALHQLNTGTGVLDASLENIANFNGRDLTLSFDGTGWSAVEAGTGQSVALSGTGSAADPLRVNGIAIVVSGAPAAGDRFLVQPAAHAAGRVQVAIADPSRIAAASPLKASAALNNVGNAVPSLSLENLAHPNFADPVRIDFIDGGTTSALRTIAAADITGAIVDGDDADGDGDAATGVDFAGGSFTLNGETIGFAALAEQTDVAAAKAQRLADIAAAINGNANLAAAGIGATINGSGDLEIAGPVGLVFAGADPDVSGITDGATATSYTPGPVRYSVDGGPSAVYDPANGIAVNGWRMKLDNPPLAGDRFDVEPRGPGSSDNGNMLRLAAIGDFGQLEGGNVSINGALGALTVAVGSAARHAEYSLDAQSIIDGQLVAEREATSGVNLDEEAANLLRYQQAYQAAAQVIAAADTLFQSLINAVRR